MTDAMTDAMTDPAARAMIDELEIRNLVARIAQLADMGELDEYVACFTDDACWVMPGNTRRGRVELRAGAEQRRADGIAGPGSATRHVVSTMAVVVDRAGGTARSSAYWQFYEQTADEPRLKAMGHYDDRLVRTVAGWQVHSRTVTPG
jgi:uncharacterized protein (TIGR02246 family)